MALDLRLQQKMAQQLVMTPQLQQAIKLLQLSHMEIADVLRSELEENPILEEQSNNEGDDRVELEGEMSDITPEGEPLKTSSEGDGEAPSQDHTELAKDMAKLERDANGEPSKSEVAQDIDWENYLESYSYSLPATAGAGGGDDAPPFEASLTKPESLVEHLRWQIHMNDFSPRQQAIANRVVEELNSDGYLIEDAAKGIADDLEIDAEEVDSVVDLIQECFEPIGVGARNLRECLLIQASRDSTDNPLAIEIIDKHLTNVEKRNISAIAKDLNVTQDEVRDAIKFIAHLEPRPGRTYTDKEPQYITPDIYVVRVGDGYEVLLNEDGLPKLKISNYYRNAIAKSKGETKNYIQEKLRGAVWLIRSIHMRQRTIYKVMESILKFQKGFFDHGVSHLKPLILKDVAEDVEMHESTISRVTSNKYVHCPQGIFELKYFFNSSISRVGSEDIASEAVRNQIKRLVAQENPKAPYSDQQLVEHLRQNNIKVARRTVAKYREMLKIPPSSKRKKLY